MNCTNHHCRRMAFFRLFLGRRVFLLLAGLVLPFLSRAAEPAPAEDAQALLNKTFEQMLSLKTFHATFATTIQSGGKSQAVEGEVWFERPGKGRLEVRDPAKGGITIVTNGNALLMSFDQPKGYAKRTIPQDQGLGGTMGKMMPGLFELLEGKPLLGTLAEPVSLTNEAIEGQNTAAIEIRPLYPAGAQGSYTLSVRPEDGTFLGSQLRLAAGDTTVQFTLKDVTANEPIDPARFSIEPPEGYTDLAGEKKESPFVGQPIKDFSFKPLQGGDAVSLSDFKNSPVIMDIWATWCQPCQAALPFLNQAAALGKAEGLKVICVSNEEPETVKKFLEKNPYDNLAFYIDEEKNASQLYNIQGIPTTFAIDPQSIIQGVEEGFGGPDALQALVAKLGITVDLSAAQAKPPKAKAVEEALTKFLQGDRQGALEAFQSLSEANPSDADVVEQYILALCAAGKKDEAASAAKQLAKSLDDPMALNNLAYLMAELDFDLPAAETFARDALAKQQDAGVEDTLGWILLKEGKIKEALELLEKAATGQSDSGFVWYHLGRAHEANGDTAAARLSYRKAVQMGQAPDDAQKRLDALTASSGPASKNAVQGTSSEEAPKAP